MIIRDFECPNCKKLMMLCGCRATVGRNGSVRMVPSAAPNDITKAVTKAITKESSTNQVSNANDIMDRDRNS